MDQRRVFLFLFLAFMVLALNTMIFPPERQPRKLPPEVAVEQPEEEQLNEGQPDQQKADAPSSVVGDSLATDEVDEDVEANELIEAELAEESEPELAFATLGSLDEETPYRMLVTFTSEGAGVRRVELASPRFRDLHDRGGYLGHLELEPHEDGGLVVQVVGAATPAEQAGLEVGDRIVSATVNAQVVAIETTGQLEGVLANSRPDTRLTVNYFRDGVRNATEVPLGRRPLEVMRPERENVRLRTGSVPPGFVEYPSYLMTLGQIDREKLSIRRDEEQVEHEVEELAGVSLRDVNWEIAEQDESSITFRKLLPQRRLEVIKRYTLERAPEGQETNPNFPAYALQLDLSVRNLSSQVVDVAYWLDGPNGLPIEGWWYAHKIGRNWSGAGLRDVLGRYYGSVTAEQSPTTIAEGKAIDFEGGSMAFVGVDAQYFASMIIPHKETIEEEWLDIVRPLNLGPSSKGRGNEGRFANVTTRLMSIPFTIEPQESLDHSYTMFMGPKRPELLSQYMAWNNPQYSLVDVLTYGWFGKVAQAMLAILHFFYGIVHNYGIAIILLTVLVRSCLFPLSRKQALSMARMQELRPEMERIKEKYKSDMQKQSQAMQELYRKHKINPLSGCLPMFIQLPIFLGLYRALMVDVELRQAPLISDAIRFCSDLAAPDRLLDWSAIMPNFINSGDGLFSPGPYLNILPLVTVGLFIVQQKMFMPEPTNEQAALQQKMMKYMMMFMAILFYKVASGLCIYFIASSLWGICERKMLPKITMPDLPGMGGTTPSVSDKKPSPRSGSNGAPKPKKSRQKKKR